MSISENEAREVVEKHLSEQDLKGYRYEFVKVSYTKKRPDEYDVVFNIYSPENAIIDGPAVFIVDKNSGEVSVL